MPNPRRELAEAIKEDQARQELAAEVDWAMQVIDFLQEYAGDNPILRSLAYRAKKFPNWVPTERQVIQVHRIVHREKTEANRIETDSLGRRLRKREGPDLPTSLDEPDWL